MQVLQITTHPGQFELEIEHGRLEPLEAPRMPSADVQRTPPKMTIQTEPTELRLDTYQARKSLGFRNSADLSQDGFDKGKKQIEKKTREYVEDGEQLSRIDKGVTIAQVVKQKMLEVPDSGYTVFLPSTGAEVSWQPGSMMMDYDPGEVHHQWNLQQRPFEYVPGSVRLNMVERPYVEIEYIGGPLYFPPSAAPDYEEPAS